MLARILGRHSDILAFPELHFVEELWEPALPQTPARAELVARLLQNSDNRYFDPLDATNYIPAAKELLGRLPPEAGPCQVLEEVIAQAVSKAGKRIGCEQTPKNVYYLRDLLDRFPSSVAINIVRDPRDVVYSQKDWWRRVFRQYSFPWRGIPWIVTLRRWAQYHPLVTAKLWRGGVEAGEQESRNPRVISIRFEDLIVRPEPTLAPLMALLGIEFQDEMLRIAGNNSSHSRPGARSAGLDPAASGNWRQGLTRAELWFVERQTFPLAEQYGYVSASRSFPFITVPLLLALLPLKVGTALLLRVGSPRRFYSSVKLRFFSGRR